MMEGVFSPLIFLFVSAFCFCSDPPYCFVRNEFVAFNSLKCDALPQFCVDTPCSPERGCLFRAHGVASADLHADAATD